MFITQIQLGSKGYLAIKEDVQVPLNFSVAEIQDISKKQGGYSKTIQLPGTSNNNILLGNLFDVNIYESTFNQNIKERCIIIQNGVPVFNGFLQLLNVNKTSTGQGGMDDLIEYEVAVRDDTGSFYSALDGGNVNILTGENYTGYLTDFDLSQYDHKYTLSSVTATSAFTEANAYKYHMFYNLKDYYEITDFHPGIFGKKYFDMIFDAIGYTYEWDSINTVDFDKMIIPYNGDKALDDTSDLEFMVGWSASTSGITSESFVQQPNNVFYKFGYLHINYNDESTGVLDDSNNLFNLGTDIYTSNYYGVNTIKSKYTYEVYYYTPVALTLSYLNAAVGGDGLIVQMNTDIWKEPNNVYPSKYSAPPYTQQSYSIGSTLPVGYTKILEGVSTLAERTDNVIPGTQYESFVKQNQYFTNSVWKDGGGAQASPRIYVKVGINPTDYDNNYFKDSPAKTLLNEGRWVRMNSYIPKNQKWKDYISGIVKLFNLYLTPSKDNDKHIIIQTRDDFYDSGSSIDWTNKLDISKENKIQFLPDLQNKNILLTYKKGSDVWNTQYEAATGEIYGQAMYTFENQFVQSIKKIETIFESTPLNETYSGGGNNIVSVIDSQIPKTGLRILYDCGWITGNDWKYRSVIATTTATTTFNGVSQGYPYAGHFYPTPINPTDDLNFGQTDYMFYDSWETLTDNNLYNKYYKRYLNQIETGKLFTGYFNLNEYDILNLDFRDKVWIHDSYWFINRIVDYNANSGSLTKVELINVDEGITFEPFTIKTYARRNKVDFSNEYNLINKAYQDTTNLLAGNNSGIQFVGGGNIAQYGSKNVTVIGDYSNISGTNSIIVGDNNTVTADNSFVMGSNVTGDVTGSFIYGEDIVISSGVTSVFIFGDDIIADTSNTSYFRNIILQSGSTFNGLPVSAVTAGASTWTSGSTGLYSIKTVGNTGDATNQYSVAEGQNTLASGFASHSEGASTTASGYASHSEGTNTTASGQYSHAEGSRTTAIGWYSHTEGSGTTAIGAHSHAEGQQTIAIGFVSHSEGSGTIASGYYSHAEGSGTTAIGYYSHSGGYNSIASGTTSFVHGNNSNANGIATVVLGNNITGSSDNTTYVENLNIKTGKSIKTSNGGGQIDLDFGGVSGSLSLSTDNGTYGTSNIRMTTSDLQFYGGSGTNDYITIEDDFINITSTNGAVQLISLAGSSGVLVDTTLLELTGGATAARAYVSLEDNLILMDAGTSAAAVVDVQSPLLLNRLTTTQRNAITAQNGMLIYNTTDNKFQGYENGAWANLI